MLLIELSARLIAEKTIGRRFIYLVKFLTNPTKIMW
jgi:hypothetical protein